MFAGRSSRAAPAADAAGEGAFPSAPLPRGAGGVHEVRIAAYAVSDLSTCFRFVLQAAEGARAEGEGARGGREGRFEAVKKVGGFVRFLFGVP